MKKIVVCILTLSVSIWIISSDELDAQSVGHMVRLSNHLPQAQMLKSQQVGRLSQDISMDLTISLALRNRGDLTDLLENLYDPKSSLYGNFLSSEEFANRYYPSATDVEMVKKYLRDQGLTIKSQIANTIQISGTVHQVESAFATEMHQYQVKDFKGRSSLRFASTQDPVLRSDIASKVSGIAGLSNFSNFISHAHVFSGNTSGIGTGPSGGVSPSDLQKAYSIPTAASATGQTLALMELDGYKPADISSYATHFGLTQTTLQNILVDGANGSAGTGEIEVALDIELMMALAPNASKILVYEGVNSDAGVIDLYAKIASDNLAKQVGTSWGSPEMGATASFLNSESAAFMQMAAQGQSIYAAAGDSGAYDDQSTLSVDDPSSQPFVTSAGGTTLSINSDGTYKSESSWGIKAKTQADSQGGGGGISSYWPIPTWQAGIANSSNKGSQTMRMVPDISANANPNTGYAIVVDGAFTVVGGTSCVAPILAAVTALVNSERKKNNVAPLGFANPTLYRLNQSSGARNIFNDVADSSTNLFYPAVSGYDLSTGVGSIAMQALFPALVNPLLPPTIPGGLAVTPHFAVLTLTWTPAVDAQSYSIYRALSPGGTFTAIASGITSTKFSDTSLKNGLSYYYYVVATDASGASGQTSVISGTPAILVPEPPISLTVKAVVNQ